MDNQTVYQDEDGDKYIPYWIMRYGMLSIKLIPIEDEEKVDESYMSESFKDFDSNTEYGKLETVEKTSLKILNEIPSYQEYSPDCELKYNKL